MSRDRVDVVIPVYNGARYLAEAVRSAAAQDAPPAKIIVVDDGSTDDTMAVARRLQEDIPNLVVLSIAHAGVSAARNAGIRASDAPFVAFLDSDDLWDRRKLSAQLAVLAQAPPEVGWVHTFFRLIDADGSDLPVDMLTPPTLRGPAFEPVLMGYPLSGSASSVLVRRDVLDRAGYFDERLYYGEDWDLWVRFAAISHLDFVNEPLVAIRAHSASSSRRGTRRKLAGFFLQRLVVYEKWPDHTSGRDFARQLRSEAVITVFPAMLSPGVINQFYRSLQSSRLGRSLFANRADLWMAMAYQSLRYIRWKLRQWTTRDA